MLLKVATRSQIRFKTILSPLLNHRLTELLMCAYMTYKAVSSDSAPVYTGAFQRWRTNWKNALKLTVLKWLLVKDQLILL